MNEVPPIPEAPAPTPPPLPQFKDRRTGLVMFGILEIILGVFCLLMVGLMVLGQLMLSQSSKPEFNLGAFLPAAATYLLLAASFVWLGIGSIQCRRWARALTLILAWCWLSVGLVAVPFMGYVLPRMMANMSQNGQAIPPGMKVAIVVFQLLFMSFVMIVIPAVLVFFYRSPHVKATCDLRDPMRRWTDACPLPVLGVSCTLWLGAAMFVVMSVAYRGVMPFFGVLVTGWTGSILMLGMAALWIWLGYAWYQLRVLGWRVLAGVMAVFIISNFVTFSRVDMLEMYRAMGYSQAQVDLIRQQGFMSSELIRWSSVVWLILMFGYLFWVKRFFKPTPLGG